VNVAIEDDYLKSSKPEPLSGVSRRIRDGDLLLCSADDPFSRLIGWSTKSPWTHVALAFRWPSLGRVMVFEAVTTIGVRAVPIAKFISETSSGQKPYPGKIVLARHEDFSDKSAAHGAAKGRMIDFAVDHLGDRFAGGEILKIAARMLVGRFERKMPKLLGPKHGFICSEYVAKCFEAMGVEVAWDGLGFIAPADFARDLKTRAITQIKTR
jgi:hypothetical protein